MATSADRRHSRTAFPFGVFIIILALVGAGFLITLGVKGVESLADNTKSKLEYQKMLTHVVMYDPDPFDDINDANFSQLIDCSIWEYLSGDISASDLKYDESGKIIVSQADVEQTFASLFGTDVSIADKHATVEGYGYEFIYSPTRQSYLIPVTGIMPLFTPKVVDIDKSKNSVVLTVGYLASGDWQQDEEGNFIEPAPDKYMKITVREKDGKEYISAIQVTDGGDTATTNSGEATQPNVPEVLTTSPQTSAAAESTSADEGESES